ncbi:hypothetical protein MesoLjLc_44510 [Mesorhizobium sp. L-8-10]|nr:hypothetical protein MesoLjLc_44510 [Mesorhizobium sp. L-8-10]
MSEANSREIKKWCGAKDQTRRGSQGRPPVGRPGRPIGAVSEANSREIKKWCGAKGQTRRVRKGDRPSAGQAAPSER